jgi:urease accessory protein
LNKMPEAHAQNGFASLHVSHVHGASSVVGCRSRTPLSLLTPRARGSSVWAYTSSLGGGMVAGDSINLDIRIDEGAICFLGSQASNKVYRNPRGLACSHTLNATIGEHALLVLAPDPVQCFSEASYEQRQTFALAASANLVLVDWFTAGRMARGERWSLNRYYSRNEVSRSGTRLVIDAVNLDARAVPLTNAFRVGRFNCFATAFVIGPLIQPFATQILERIAREPISPQSTLLRSLSSVKDGAMIRIAGASIEEVGHSLYGFLDFVPRLLKDDPWLRKW